jgi:hypothetical protein
MAQVGVMPTRPPVGPFCEDCNKWQKITILRRSCTVRGSNPVRVKRLLSSLKCQDRLWGPLSLPFIGYRVIFWQQRGWGVKVNHSPPSNAEVKNEWSYTSTHPICLHGADREKFAFIVVSTYIHFISRNLSQDSPIFGHETSHNSIIHKN